MEPSLQCDPCVGGLGESPLVKEVVGATRDIAATTVPGPTVFQFSATQRLKVAVFSCQQPLLPTVEPHRAGCPLFPGFAVDLA